MTYYQLHPLNARHGLTAVLPGLRATVAEAVRLTQAHAALPDFDVTVRVDPDRCIPGWGVGGLAPAPGVIEIAVIPDLCTPERPIRTLVHEFHHLIHIGAGPGRSAFLSAFFTLVGTHGLHVTFGSIWLVTLMVQVSKFGLTQANQRRLMCLSLFWHFLDLIWIGVFTVVYLLGVL